MSPAAPPYWIDARPLVSLQGGDPRFVGAAHDRGNARRLVSGRDNPLRGRGFVIYPAIRPGVWSRHYQG